MMRKATSRLLSSIRTMWKLPVWSNLTSWGCVPLPLLTGLWA
ncbi:Uncharacterised protein [Vibrio cholerae]|nr:Uncharacterised protein [Vibrio cholerae]